MKYFLVTIKRTVNYYGSFEVDHISSSFDRLVFSENESKALEKLMLKYKNKTSENESIRYSFFIHETII